MKYVFALLMLFCSTFVACADRALYTSELVESATLIGVWRGDNIAASDSFIQFERPDMVLKGDFTSLAKAKQYSSRLTDAVHRIKTDGPFILFIVMDGEIADLVGDSGRMHYSPIALKAVKSVIFQLELQEKWENLSIHEQIEQSELIVSGMISDEGPDCPKEYTISLDKTYRGIPPERLSVLPVTQEQLGIDSLFFVQRHSGVGPDYIVMNAIPLIDALNYLKELKGTKIPQQSGPECLLRGK